MNIEVMKDLFNFNDTQPHRFLENRKYMLKQASYQSSYFIILESYIETGKHSDEMSPSFENSPASTPLLPSITSW